MYAKIRTIHLLLGLFSLAFLLMYGISAIQMAHPTWFPKAEIIRKLNRLHHAAGFWREPVAMKVWAAGVGVISLGLLGIGGTGLYMWFVRRQERVTGAILLVLNVGFALTVLALLRAAGP